MNGHDDDVGFNPSTKVDKQSAWRVWVIVAVLGFLALQGMVDGLVRVSGHEAYPMVAGPGFGAGKVGTDGRTPVNVRQIDVVDANGALHRVAPDALLAPMPTATAAGTIDRIFEPSADEAPTLTAETVAYLRQQALRLNLGAEPVGLRVSWQPEIFETGTLNRTPDGAATIREVTW